MCTWGPRTFGLPVLVFVQCGRGWGGRSIGNKWIQINIKLGSEGETESKRGGCCTTVEEEEKEDEKEEKKEEEVGKRGDGGVLPAAEN